MSLSHLEKDFLHDLPPKGFAGPPVTIWSVSQLSNHIELFSRFLSKWCEISQALADRKRRKRGSRISKPWIAVVTAGSYALGCGKVFYKKTDLEYWAKQSDFETYEFHLLYRPNQDSIRIFSIKKLSPPSQNDGGILVPKPQDVPLEKPANMARYGNTDYNYRPRTYWDDANPLHAILRNVKGENRRKVILDYVSQGRLDELDGKLLSDTLDEGTRKLLGQIHPSYLGGEFLPDDYSGEVEIARICLASTTEDVISLRACPTVGGEISYRVVDEYGCQFHLPFEKSNEPLTMAEMIKQLDGCTPDDGGKSPFEGGLPLGYNNRNASNESRERLRNFTRISSGFYPGLASHYENVYDAWVKKGA